MNPYNHQPQGGQGYPPGPPQPGFIGGFQPQAPPGQAYPSAPNFPGGQPYVGPPSDKGYPPPGQNYPPPQGYYPPPQAYGGPIVSQPGAGTGGYASVPAQDGWMNMPQRIPNCPPGLEYLTSIDQLLVKEKVELLDVFTGFESNNKFTIKNSLGQKVYWAAEDNDCCTRNCCEECPFDMKIMDIHKTQVLHLHRPLRCDCCCFPCCLQTMEVSSPPGTVIGTVKQNWSILYPNFDLKDQSGQTVLKIEGPLCTYSLCGNVEFKVMTLDGRQVGQINKQWAGLAREMFTDADYFGISFPMDLDVRMKAVLLGACFLITLPIPILRNVFSRFGNLIDIYLLPNKNCGYAKYATEESCQTAIESLHGAEICGVRMRVMEAEELSSERKRFRRDE